MDSMMTKLVILLIAAVFLMPASTQKVADKNCVCQRNGNNYTQLEEHNCEKFTQTDEKDGKTRTFDCPKGLKFSIDNCVCDHAKDVRCLGCGPPVCEVELNERFEEILGLQRQGKCLEAEETLRSVLAPCVVRDPVIRMLTTIKYVAANEREKLCEGNIVQISKGCELLPKCFLLLSDPDNLNDDGIDVLPKFLCENYNEAIECLQCAKDKGCDLVDDYLPQLLEAGPDLCPYMQTFTCDIPLGEEEL